MNDLIENIDKLHTTELGEERIRKNLCLSSLDVVGYCKEIIISNKENIIKRGKNYYITYSVGVITVNANSFTIITAKKRKQYFFFFFNKLKLSIQKTQISFL